MPTLAEEIIAGILAMEPPDDRPPHDALLRKLKERQAARQCDDAIMKLMVERMEAARQQFEREVVEPHWRKIMEEGNSEGLLNLLK